MADSEQTYGTKKSCCLNPANLAPKVQMQGDIWVTICRECGCKHWEANAEPGHIGLKAF